MLAIRTALLVLLALAAVAPVQAGIAPVTADGKILSLAPMLAEVTPAVVNIAVSSGSPEADNPLLQDPFFRRFFGLPDEQPQARLAAGSGVIVDAASGYVLTNHHVVRGAREVVVILKDRREFKARLVGSDAGTDIAVLRIEAENLRALKLGDSDALSVGDFVLAIGNPFGIGQTVTSGIVSALGRSGLNIEGYEDFIQTDAAINPGNSGGALVNLKGELIGINTAIIGPAGGNVGIGFAVPSNMVRQVRTQIVKYSEVRRGRFGATTQDLTPELAKALNVRSTEGVVVVDVASGGPAERAGLRRGDIVTTVNGRKVRGSADLRNQVGLVPIGDEVELRIVRQGEERTVRARIEPVASAKSRTVQTVPELAGASVGTFEANGQPQAVLVVRVVEGSPAWNQGLREKDLIAAVNRRKVRSVQELLAALRVASRPIVLSVIRGESVFAVVLR
jgi:serine protease Do/serine protease DegQ